LIPVVGWPIGLAYIALINSYYSYEWIFVFRSWGLDYRCTYIADRTAYMFGFGASLIAHEEMYSTADLQGSLLPCSRPSPHPWSTWRSSRSSTPSYVSHT
jgi:hypothetical protein